MQSAGFAAPALQVPVLHAPPLQAVPAVQAEPVAQEPEAQDDPVVWQLHSAKEAAAMARERMRFMGGGRVGFRGGCEINGGSL